MATPKNPVVFCAAIPECPRIELQFPFGLPPKSFADPCCQGLDASLDQLSNVMRPLYPFLQVIGCFMKLVEIVIDIPGCIGPPPDPSKIAKLVQKLTEFTTQCVPYLASLIPSSPLFVLQFCKMLRGYTMLLAALLRCLKKTIIVNSGVFAEALVLSQSPDPKLREMGTCMQEQATALQAQLSSKLSELNNIFDILNAVLGLIPPVSGALASLDPPQYPIKARFDLGQPVTDTTAIDAIITVLSTVNTALIVCSGGA